MLTFGDKFVNDVIINAISDKGSACALNLSRVKSLTDGKIFSNWSIVALVWVD